MRSIFISNEKTATKSKNKHINTIYQKMAVVIIKKQTDLDQEILNKIYTIMKPVIFIKLIEK